MLLIGKLSKQKKKKKETHSVIDISMFLICGYTENMNSAFLQTQKT